MSRVSELLEARAKASRLLAAELRSLEDAERVEALRLCRQAGVSAIELASLMGVSRARVYQLLSQSTSRTEGKTPRDPPKD